MDQIDTSTIERARREDEYLDRLIAAVWPEAYRIAFGILHDRGLAEDAAQEACAAMARSLGGLKDARAFRGWCYKIIVNCALSTARRLPRVEQLEAIPDRDLLFDQSDTLDLHNALAALTPKRRALILLHYYAGLNSAEIAVATGSPASTIRFQLMLARRALRKALSQPQSSSEQTNEEAITDVR